MDLTASSAVNLPISNANLRLGVVRMGVRSTRSTYSVMSVPPRFTFTTNFVFFMFVTASVLRRTSPLDIGKELKEALTTLGHRNSPVRNPEFPSFHEAATQSLF